MPHEDEDDVLRKAGGQQVVLDTAWFRDWRKETSADIREVRTRLTAIESSMAEGAELMSRHSLQLAELAANVAEIDVRLGKLEEFRNRHEIRCEEERERVRRAGGAWHSSAVKTAINTAIAFVVGGIFSVVVWGVASYLRANPPAGVKP